MNSLFYYLVTAHEHQEGYDAVPKVRELYDRNTELFENLWQEAVANCGKDGIDIHEFNKLLAQDGLYIQFDPHPWAYTAICEPVYSMDLRIYPMYPTREGKGAILKVSVRSEKE